MKSLELLKKSAGIDVTYIFRDLSQTLFDSRIPLGAPGVLDLFRVFGRLAELKNQKTPVRFNEVETGGTFFQAEEILSNGNYPEAQRKIADAVGPLVSLRELVRGLNGSGLKPAHDHDLQWTTKRMVDDIAGKHTSSVPKAPLFKQKLFQSQLYLEDLIPMVEQMAALQKGGYPRVGVEIAIPYTNGASCEVGNPNFNPYPDSLFIDKAGEAIDILLGSGMPPHLVSVSFKDMIGEMEPQTAMTLTKGVIEIIKGTRRGIGFGLHLHHTGYAPQTYAAAIWQANNMDYPVRIDTVEGTSTGFASLLAVEDALNQEYALTLGLTSEQKHILYKLREQTDELMQAYALARVPVTMTGEQLRLFKIPGGAFSSFVRGVGANKLDKKLNISLEDAVLVAANGLRVVAPFMGHPPAVTPGHHNKYLAMLNLLNNMIASGYFNDCRGVQQILEKLLIPLTNQQIEAFFLHNLPPEVQEFLKTPTPHDVHPLVRQKLPLRTGLSNEGVKSLLPAIKKEVESLQKEGLIIPTSTQYTRARTICMQMDGYSQKSQSEQEKMVEDEARKMAYASNVSRGLVRGVGVLTQGLRTPWEAPVANKFIGRSEAYARAMQRFKDGRNPAEDEMEKLRSAFMDGKLSLPQVETRALLLLQAERAAIGQGVVQLLGQDSQHALLVHVIHQMTQGVSAKAELAELAKAIQVHQIQMNSKHTAKGEAPLYTLEHQVEIALNILGSIIEKTVPQEQAEGIYQTLQEIHKSMESSDMRAVLPGKVLKLLVKLEDGKTCFVKKGDPLVILESMKMEIILEAPKDGEIEELCVKVGDTVEHGKVLVKYKERGRVSENHLAEMTEPSEEALKIGAGILQYLDTYYKGESDKAIAMMALQPEPSEISHIPVLTPLQKQGYNVSHIHLVQEELVSLRDAVHVVINRGGCATKIYGDLMQASAENVILCSTLEDRSTPLIQHANPKQVIELEQTYTHKQEIIGHIKATAKQYPNRMLVIHPGWGFLAEDVEFVKLIEQLQKEGISNVRFAGPPSIAMELAGGKHTFRDLLQEVVPQLNPQYFKTGESISDDEHKRNFERIQQMGGNVVIKATAGGGGKGIELFTYDPKESKEANYDRYLEIVKGNIEYAKRAYADGTMITEQCITGNTRHLEIQFAISGGKAIILGERDCTHQKKRQKNREVAVKEGDYPPELMASILADAQVVGDALASKGYTGLATFEMLVLPTGKKIALEVNPRLQVEHITTELNIQEETGIHISLPLLNAQIALHPDETPQEILKRTYGFTNEQIENLGTPQQQGERIVNMRVNCKEVNLKIGNLVPTWFGDHMWPPFITTWIAEKTRANMIQGGLGTPAKWDSQVGTIVGTLSQVQAASQMLLDFSRLAQLWDRKSTDPLNLKTALEFLELRFDKHGNLRDDVGTPTIDLLLGDIREGRIPSLADPKKVSPWPGEYVTDLEALRIAVERIGKEQVTHENPHLGQPHTALTSTSLEPKKKGEILQAA